MYSKLFLSALLATIILSSCSMYNKTGQTPDDLYYAPTQPSVNKNDEMTENKDSYSQPDDNYLRMKIKDRYKWNRIDDMDYWYGYNNYPYYSYNSWAYNTWDPFNNYGYYYNYSGYNYNSYYGWGHYGYWNPSYYIQTVRSNTGPKPYMEGYTNHSYSNSNNSTKSINVKTGSGFGNFLKTIVGGNNSATSANTYNSSNETYSRPVRTFSNSSSSSSGSNSSSGRTSSGSSSSGGRSGRN